jgi:hypothetical protein
MLYNGEAYTIFCSLQKVKIKIRLICWFTAIQK